MSKEIFCSLFPLFTDIRLKIKPNDALMWFLSILLLIQNTLAVFFSDKPTILVNLNVRKDPGVHALLAFLFIPWYNSTEFVLFDVSILLFLQISLFIFIWTAVYKKRFGFYVSIVHLLIIYHLTLFLSYGMSVPLYFRFSHSIACIIRDKNIISIFSFVLVILSLILHFIVIYLKSVFLDQFDFIPESTFSLYEGKSSPFFRVIHSVSLCSCFMIPLISNLTVQQGVAFLTLAISLIGFYFRVLPCPHYSIVGQFMDTSFLFFTAPILITRSFLQCFENYFILIFIFLNIICYLVLFIMRKQVAKKSIEMFKIFANFPVNNSAFSSRTGISPHNYVTVIRVYALNIADPVVFERFRKMQQLFDLRASIQIEIIRFLGLFPSKRAQMLDEIQNISSKSVYNRFMLHLFSDKLSALTMQSTDADRSSALDLYSALASRICKYWRCRSRNKKFKAFHYGLLSTTLRIELKHELKALIAKFPFDPKVRNLYFNFLVISNGDPEEIKNQKNILRELTNKTIGITDPLLHNVAGYNPRILRYLTKSEKETCSCITTIRTKPTFGKQVEENEISQFLIKPQRTCVFSTLFTSIFIALLLIVFISLLIEHEYRSSIISDQTFDVNNQTIDRFYISSATFIIAFTNLGKMINTSEIIPLETDEECFNFFLELEKNERSFYHKNPKLFDFAAYATSSLIEMYLKYRNYSLCEAANYLNENPALDTIVSFESAVESISQTRNQIQLELRNFTKMDRFILLIILFWVGFVLITFLYFFGFFIFLNHKMKKYKKYFNFLGSESRKDLIEEGRAEDSWELLKDENSRSPEFEEVSMRSKNVYFGLKPLIFHFLVPWIISILILLVITIPHFLRVNLQSETHKSFDLTYYLVKDVIHLLINILTSILGTPIDRDESSLLANKIKNSTHAISSYFTEHLYVTNDKKSISAYMLIEKYISGQSEPLSETYLEDVFVPNLFDFARYSVITVFVQEANTREVFHIEAVISFCIVIFAVVVIYVISGYHHFRTINNSISKLFIFPTRYIDEKDNKGDRKESPIPDNLLVITIITDTKKIYSVSENSIHIINKNSSSLINTNFFDLFSNSPDNDPNFLILKSTDKKKSRVFKVNIIEKGQVTHYLLLDDSSKVLSSSPNTSLSTQLSNFMTQFFADQFSQENVKTVMLNNTYFIFLLIKMSEIDINTVESVYNNLFSQLTKSFSNVHCIKVDGSLIELAISNSSSILNVLFLLRDLVNNPKLVVGIQAVFIDHFDEIRFTLNTVDEPCVECENEDVVKDENVVYQLKQNHIVFHSSLLQMLPEPLKNGTTQKIPTDFCGQNTMEVVLYTISDYLYLISKAFH